jgi:hypothetical protein
MHLRFTIRDLLWLTLAVALAVGWSVDRTVLHRFCVIETGRDLRVTDKETGEVWIKSPGQPWRSPQHNW